METAGRDYGQATYRIAAGRGQIARLQRQITGLGDDTTNEVTNRRRRELQAALAQAQSNVAEAVLAQQQAMASVQGDAERRGVTATEYLHQGMGRITDDTQEEFRRLDRDRGIQSEFVETIARRLGVRVQDLAGATTITRRLQEMQAAALRRENENPQETVKALLQEYGFRQSTDTGDLSQVGRRLAELMEGTRGRSMGRRMLETARTLRQRAEQRADGRRGTEGVDDMATVYFRAIQAPQDQREARIRDFQRQYGFEMSHGQLTQSGQEQFRQFEQAIQFQQQTGLLSVARNRSDHRTRNREEDLAALFNQAMQGGEVTRPQAPGVPGAPGIPGRIELGGTVTLRGDQLDMAGAWGGQRGFFGPGGT